MFDGDDLKTNVCRPMFDDQALSFARAARFRLFADWKRRRQTHSRVAQ
jgi:hypothetical protein